MAPAATIANARERAIDGPGGPLRIRIYTPHGAGPFPLLVFFHGSGFVLCISRVSPYLSAFSSYEGVPGM